MHLKRLELLGFKSFANKTVLELDRGVTGVVGPNGSGKSNVVDAVRWALGEQSLRAVRSRKSEEVIFAGNNRKTAVGMAEVTMVLDNSDGSLPLPFTEISVTRRHYRSGESEYLINRSRARLKDVVELLTHANLGPDAYAVVGQGAVDEVLLQRPEERRALLETAADISRYQLKLRESLEKLAETEANLQRVEDIQSEITPRLAKLRIQANRARRYEEVARKLKEMLQWRYLLQVQHGIEKTNASLAMEQTRAQAVAEASRNQEVLRERAARMRDQLRQEELALEAAREKLNAFRMARARSERETALAQEREAAFRRENREAQEELASARKEHRELEADLERLRTSRTALAARESEARAAMDPIEGEKRRALSEQRLLQAQMDRLAGERQSMANRRSELQERCNALSRQSRRTDESRAESILAARESTEKLTRLEGELAMVQAEMDRLRSLVAEAEERQRNAQARLKAVSAEMDAARRKERESWERDNHLKTRLSLLQSLREEHRGIPPGARTLLEARLPGIRGTLAAQLTVPREYVTAIAAALGSAQSYVVSEGFQEALEAIRHLKDGVGRATVAPLRIEERESPAVLVEEFRSGLNGTLKDISFRGFASELVDCTPGSEELCARYLGLTLVVEKMSDAVELFRRLNRLTGGRLPFQVVTLDGRILRARGDLSSAPAPEKDGSLLARETELRDLSEEAEQARKEREEARAGVAKLEAAHKELSREVSEASSEPARLQKEISRQGSIHSNLSSQLAKVEAAIEWHNSRASTTEGEAAQAKEALAKAQKELADLGTRESDGDARVDQLRLDLSEQQAVVSEIMGRLSRLQSQASAAHGQLRELDARISAVVESSQRAAARAKRQEERVAQLSQSMEQLSNSPQATFGQEQKEELEATEKAVNEAAAKVNRGRDDMAAREADMASLATTLEIARDGLAEARARVERSSAELVGLLREAARELELDLGLEEEEPETAQALLQLAEAVVELLTALLAETDTSKFPSVLHEASQKAEAARKELHSLGVINPDAPEEYRSVSERHEFLISQMEDLRQAEQNLRTAIDELKEIMEDRFQKSFEQINGEFARCFSVLFGGGSARLVLTQPDQPLAGGVEVIAVPPGKKGGNLLGLSGGERALTAVALLFALMRVNPGPFCLLDEVDAALDESNVKRFCEMVRSLSENTQFLVITHNRTTMEMASALWGVSMSTDSVSKVMSLRLEEQHHNGVAEKASVASE